MQAVVQWNAGYAAWAKAAANSPVVGLYTQALAELLHSIARTLPEDGRALIISHGGIVEAGTIGCLPTCTRFARLTAQPAATVKARVSPSTAMPWSTSKSCGLNHDHANTRLLTPDSDRSRRATACANIDSSHFRQTPCMVWAHLPSMGPPR